MKRMVSSYCDRRMVSRRSSDRSHWLSGWPPSLRTASMSSFYLVLLLKSCHGLLALYLGGYTMERPRFSDHLEAIKFICKVFCSEFFKKQIDNLKTNHRGTFVLQDNRFCWLACMSVNPSPENGDLSQYNYNPLAENKAAQATSMHLNFPCGIIRVLI
uniref:Uncharacterized protein n=1 Tax=Quercus lobata TaxID=97700 RepID=A0A7N2L2R5_QUELO